MEANLSEIIKKNLQNQLNQNQELALDKIITFIHSKSKNEIFLLKGHAGTGKTYIISNIVKNLWKIKKSVILLAPTGRSAKVISSYCNKEAFTVHKEIFFTKNKYFFKIKLFLRKRIRIETNLWSKY